MASSGPNPVLEPSFGYLRLGDLGRAALHGRAVGGANPWSKAAEEYRQFAQLLGLVSEEALDEAMTAWLRDRYDQYNDGQAFPSQGGLRG